MIQIRRAEVGDLPWLLEELKKFAAFNGTRKSIFPDDIQVATDFLMGMITTQVLFLAEKEKKLMGMIGGYLVPQLFNPKIRVLAETFWWVQEEHRGSRAALLLLNEWVAFGKRAHADWITVALEALSPANERCLTKRGFKLHERSYLLEVT